MHFSDFKDFLSNLMRFKNEEIEPQFEFFSFHTSLTKINSCGWDKSSL